MQRDEVLPGERVELRGDCSFPTRTLRPDPGAGGLVRQSQGDSGGPVLYQSAGTFYAAGTIVGNQGDISSAWFLPIKYTLSSMSLFLDTGA